MSKSNRINNWYVYFHFVMLFFAVFTALNRLTALACPFEYDQVLPNFNDKKYVKFSVFKHLLTCKFYSIGVEKCFGLFMALVSYCQLASYLACSIRTGRLSITLKLMQYFSPIIGLTQKSLSMYIEFALLLQNNLSNFIFQFNHVYFLADMAIEPFFCWPLLCAFYIIMFYKVCYLNLSFDKEFLKMFYIFEARKNNKINVQNIACLNILRNEIRLAYIGLIQMGIYSILCIDYIIWFVFLQLV